MTLKSRNTIPTHRLIAMVRATYPFIVEPRFRNFEIDVSRRMQPEDQENRSYAAGPSGPNRSRVVR